MGTSVGEERKARDVLEGGVDSKRHQRLGAAQAEAQRPSTGLGGEGAVGHKHGPRVVQEQVEHLLHSHVAHDAAAVHPAMVALPVVVLACARRDVEFVVVHHAGSHRRLVRVLHPAPRVRLDPPRRGRQPPGPRRHVALHAHVRRQARFLVVHHEPPTPVRAEPRSHHVGVVELWGPRV